MQITPINVYHHLSSISFAAASSNPYKAPSGSLKRPKRDKARETFLGLLLISAAFSIPEIRMAYNHVTKFVQRQITNAPMTPAPKAKAKSQFTSPRKID